MKKHRIDKIRELSGASEPETTPEAAKQARENVVNMIMNVFDRLPENPEPVAESLETLLDQMRHGIKREAVIIQTNEKRISVADGVTQIISDASDVTKNFPAELTKQDLGKSKFSDFEIELLRQIENGEH
jgi:hypothetical protein